MSKEQTKKDVIKVGISGVLHFVGNFNEKTTTTFSDKMMVRFSLSDYTFGTDARETIEKAFENASDTFTPKWLKEETKYINFKSAFEVPVVHNKKQFNSSDVVSGAKVQLLVTVKDGAIYPSAINIIENGSFVNPFETVEENLFE